MNIKINIAEQDEALLATWASVLRTLTIAQEACDYIAEGSGDDNEVERFGNCSNELEELAPVLDRLHSSVREEIWKLRKEESGL